MHNMYQWCQISTSLIFKVFNNSITSIVKVEVVENGNAYYMSFETSFWECISIFTTICRHTACATVKQLVKAYRNGDLTMLAF